MSDSVGKSDGNPAGGTERDLRLAIDVGGTFTDVLVLNEQTGAVEVTKVPSGVDPVDGILNGLDAARIDMDRVALFSHGTTAATNALITRDLPRVAMVTTKGFRDVIEIRNGTKDDLWDTYNDVAPPYIRRRDRLVVTERIDHTGKVLQPLDEEEARRVARGLRKRGVESVAVCFINSYANPVHEQRMGEILAEELPGVPVSLSSEVVPEMFEHPRFSTTTVNAVLEPRMASYGSRMSEEVAKRGYERDVLFLHSGGGVITSRNVGKVAARLEVSGLPAGVVAARHIASLCGYREAIGLDMGGTSADVSLIYDGRARITKEWSVEYGYPILFPSIEVMTIGAGGGSIAWIDDGGALRNGPQSAGAYPGPACYGQGGTEPTNTDAHLVLGRLGEALAGGALTLDRDLSLKAIAENIGKPLGLDTEEAAEAILRVSNSNMANALRLVSIARGYDPRDFALVAFGGAGPLHGAELAAELSIPTVIVPPHPGLGSALGCLLVDVRHDLTQMVLGRVDSLVSEDLEASFREMEEEANRLLLSEGVAPDRIQIQRTVDMRYAGQWRSMSVPLTSSIDTLDQLVSQFHDLYEREHNYRREDAPVEVYRIGVTGIGLTPEPQLPRLPVSDKAPEPKLTRSVKFADSSYDGTPIYAREDLCAGQELHGPAVVQQVDSTTTIPPGSTARVDEWGNIIISIDRS